MFFSFFLLKFAANKIFNTICMKQTPYLNTKSKIVTFVISDLAFFTSQNTCNRFGLKISSVIESLNNKKGLLTPFDRDSYGLLFSAHSILNQFPSLTESPLSSFFLPYHQKWAKAFDTELHHLACGSDPLYLQDLLGMPSYCVDILTYDFNLQYAHSSLSFDRRSFFDSFLESVLLIPSGYRERYLSLASQKNNLVDEASSLNLSVNSRSSDDFFIALDYIRAINSCHFVPHRFSMRTRFDAMPSYRKALSSSVQSDSWSSHQRSLFSWIADASPLTDSSYQYNINNAISLLQDLQMQVSFPIRSSVEVSTRFRSLVMEIDNLLIHTFVSPEAWASF